MTKGNGGPGQRHIIHGDGTKGDRMNKFNPKGTPGMTYRVLNMDPCPLCTKGMGEKKKRLVHLPSGDDVHKKCYFRMVEMGMAPAGLAK